MLNLLNNAVKFTPTGGSVALTVRRAAELLRPAAGPTMPVLISVRDSGIGISESDRHLIFLKYTKAMHSSTARAPPDVDLTAGAGLGLSITMAIVKQHRGTVEVD